MKKTRQSAFSVVLKILFSLFLAGTVVFIFYQSSRIGEVSGALSLRVTDRLNAWLAGRGFGLQLTNLTVRKLGHLGEYILLGFWSMLTLRVYTGRVIAHISWPLLFCLGLAVADEFFQQFVPGRTSAVSDVVIDFCGVLLGLGCALMVLLLFWGLGRMFGKR